MRLPSAWSRFLCMLVLPAGCATAPAPKVPDPAAAARAFGNALLEPSAERAYQLLHPEVRAQVDRGRFAKLFEENRAELRELSEALERAAGATRAGANVELASGEQVALVLEEGRWKVAGGVLQAQSLQTPLETVAALHRALRRRSLPALLRLLSVERRAVFAASLEESLEGTADPLDLEAEIQGDQAVVHTTGGGKIHLRREAGKWRVHDVE